MKKKNRIISLIFAMLIFGSCFTSFALPISATTSTGDLQVCYNAVRKNVWYPNSGKTSAKNFTSAQTTFSRTDDTSNVTSIVLKDTVLDDRYENGSSTHQFCGARMDVTPTRTLSTIGGIEYALSSLDLDNYNLRVYWKIDHYDGTDRECLTADYVNLLTPCLGLSETSYSAYAVPQINGIYGDTLNEYSNSPLTVTQYTMSREYLFEDTETISAILDGEFVVGFPFDVANGSLNLTYTLEMTLISTVSDDSGSTDTEDENGTVDGNVEQNVNIFEPNDYKYYPHYTVIQPETTRLNDVSISDFYIHEGTNGVKFRDSTDKYYVSSLPRTVITPVYDVILGIGYEDGYDDTDFTDSIFNVNKTTLDFSRSIYDTAIDLSLSGFRLEIFIQTANDFNYSSYTEYLDRVNSYYYGLEPFEVQIGNVIIPYDYFTFKYSADKNTLLATLELDGKLDSHRMFMRHILETVSRELTLTFTTPTPISQGIMIGIPSFGFYQKYEAETEPPATDNPDTPTNPDSGITQEDLEAAYNKGYNQGASDSSDKNYVYGFINGSFNAVNTFYKTLADGIGLGGVTLGEVITSIIIIVVLVILLKKVM